MCRNLLENIHAEVQTWRGMAIDRARTPQHTPKIILGALLWRTLDIARLVLIFKLQH